MESRRGDRMANSERSAYYRSVASRRTGTDDFSNSNNAVPRPSRTHNRPWEEDGNGHASGSTGRRSTPTSISGRAYERRVSTGASPSDRRSSSTGRALDPRAERTSDASGRDRIDNSYTAGRRSVGSALSDRAYDSASSRGLSVSEHRSISANATRESGPMVPRAPGSGGAAYGGTSGRTTTSLSGRAYEQRYSSTNSSNEYRSSVTGRVSESNAQRTDSAGGDSGSSIRRSAASTLSGRTYDTGSSNRLSISEHRASHRDSDPRGDTSTSEGIDSSYARYLSRNRDPPTGASEDSYATNAANRRSMSAEEYRKRLMERNDRMAVSDRTATTRGSTASEITAGSTPLERATADYQKTLRDRRASTAGGGSANSGLLAARLGERRTAGRGFSRSNSSNSIDSMDSNERMQLGDARRGSRRHSLTYTPAVSRSEQHAESADVGAGRQVSLEVGGSSGNARLEASREMRNRRLRGDSGTAENPTVIDVSDVAEPSKHYVAHSPAVEKYLNRKNILEGVRSRDAGSKSRIEPSRSRELASSSLGEHDRHSHAPHQDSSASENDVYVRDQSPRKSEVSVRERVKRTESNDRLQPVLPRVPEAIADKARFRDQPSATSRLKRDHSPSIEHTMSEDSSTSATSASIKGWSTIRNRQPQESQSKVDEYLASRTARRVASTVTPTLLSSSRKERFSSPRKGRSPLESRGVGLVTEVEEEESSETDTEEGSDESSADVPDVQEYSVRVCVVSAMDLPDSVVPNLPFSTQIKLGILKLPPLHDNPQDERRDEQRLRAFTESIEKDGLTSISKARVLSTSTKILSKKDNGSIEFHEELRWDHVKEPQQMALALELSSRAVLSPANYRESPPSQCVEPFSISSATNSIGRGPENRAGEIGDAGSGASAISNLFRRSKKNDSAEMETAHAAAAVAKLLVEAEDDEAGPLFDSKSTNMKALAGSQNEVDVKLRKRKRRRKTKMSEDFRIGATIIPLAQLPLHGVENERKTARIEQWFEFHIPNISPESNNALSGSTKRCPRILLEISLSTPEVRDDSEDELEEETAEKNVGASFSKRASSTIRNQLKEETPPPDDFAEPTLQPGVIDFVCVVGARDIGDQKADDGSRGWVNSTPECTVLEQFPPDDEFHARMGRNAVLPTKVEWFCFPEGCRLWRGTTPPNHEELNLKRFSASSPANMSTTFASFDACLGCTSSFIWFSIASNSDEYGSENAKTYGTVIRFYVPAPTGIDPTQDDFAQTMMGLQQSSVTQVTDAKRLWVPIGICLLSSLPIIGAMEVILLRLCEGLANSGMNNLDSWSTLSKYIFDEVSHLVLKYQRPIPGIVSCSIPFLSGGRLHLSLPSRSGIPPLPHGNAVTSVCRLLGADGLNYLLAACLTECKILLHSDDVANTALVAEVLTALIYPFQWSCPFVPVLPFGMLEVVEAPCPFLLGIPSSNLKYIDPPVLEDIVVVDLDRDFSSEYHEGRRVGVKTKSPAPLPATTATNISKAVYRLLRVEAEAAESISGQNFAGSRQFPWLEPESVAEREFRVNVAMEISSLLQGFQDCLVYAGEQTVFNVDKFMQQAPALFEEQRGKNIAGQGPGQFLARRVISPRSRKFLSEMVNGQQFHQFLESLESDSVSFYHEIVKVLDNKGNPSGSSVSVNKDKVVTDLNKILQKYDDRIATYRVKKLTEDMPAFDANGQGGGLSSFPSSMLQPIKIANDSQDDGDESTGQSGGGVRHVSIEYLVELEKNPWKYERIVNVELEESAVSEELYKVKLRDALGEKRYRAWKMSIESDKYEGEDSTIFTDGARSHDEIISLDISSLLVADDKARRLNESGSTKDHVEQATENSAQRRIADAKDRDVLRRCLERAQVAGGKESSAASDAGRDLITEAEIALRNPSAREFLLSILDRRSQELLEKKDGPLSKRRAAFKMDPHAFEVLVRLGCAMLDACLETQDFTSAYALLKSTAGLYCPATRAEPTDTYMTGRICLHPIYSNLALWESVQLARTNARGDATETGEDNDTEEDEYESTVATLYEMQGYGIPVEELARFASHVCEKKDWVHSERGKKLMMLARRLSLRREHSRLTHTRSGRSDIEMMSPISVRKRRDVSSLNHALSLGRKLRWVETGWCHPAAQSSRRPLPQEKLRRSAGLSSPEENVAAGPSYMKRSAITCMAYLGSSVVVTGGLDGGVFVARSVVEGDPIEQSKREDGPGIRGVHLDWGSSGSRYSVGASTTSVDGEYGVGAVSCLAATRGSQLSYQTPRSISPTKGTKDSFTPPQDDEILSAMDGFRVVAGTTCGDLRVWSIKDVFAAIFYSAGGALTAASYGDGRVQHRGESSSSYIRRIGVTDFAAGSSLTRLKFSLRGRALSGHRGGVSCIDVPSNVYRPDSIVSGGADGLIKLWSLRTPGTSGARRADIGTASTFLKKAGAEALSPRTKAAKSGDALSILSGHGGRVLCVKTAWHGDRLLSGGVDRTVRIWDLAGAAGKCLNTLTGHTGWVTNTQYWGANTIISASTDRSIALWDARVRSTPLFALRHHYGPISDLLVGSRTDPIMISAASDGTIAAWDFRHLAGSIEDNDISARRCCIVRDPAAKLYMHDFSNKKHVFGPVMLGRGTSDERRTVSCLGGDAVLREWDFQTGEIVVEHVTGHCDTVSSFISLSDDKQMESQLESNTSEVASSTITASWDGTVRMRRLVAV